MYYTPKPYKQLDRKTGKFVLVQPEPRRLFKAKARNTMLPSSKINNDAA